MDEFLARYALKHRKLGISSTWVLPVTLAESATKKKALISAYFTLSSATVLREEIPFKSSLPAYPLPVVLLARLAVNIEYQGQGLGEKTLITALRQSVGLTEQGLPAIGLILDVLDQPAYAFYAHYKLFEPFIGNANRLFVPMHVLIKI